MTTRDKIHLTIVSLINVTLILKMISTAWEGNDKSIILVILGYPTLIFVNALIWLIFRIFKKPEFKIYKITTFGLVILYIPTSISSSMY